MSNNDKKIGKVTSTTRSKEISKTHSIDEVEKVKETTRVSEVDRISRVGKSGGVGNITFAQREKLMRIISEEATKLAKQGAIPKSQKEVVEKAVQMAIDAALLESGEDKKA